MGRDCYTNAESDHGMITDIEQQKTHSIICIKESNLDHFSNNKSIFMTNSSLNLVYGGGLLLGGVRYGAYLCSRYAHIYEY